MFPRLHTLAFEAPEEPVAPAGGEAPEDLGGEPAAEEPFSLSREDWEQTQQALVYLAQQEQQRQAAAQGDDLGPPPDPSYDPEAFAAWLDRRDEQRLAPFNEFREQTQMSEGHERALDILADYEAAEGEFLVQASREQPIGSREMAYMLAEDRFLAEAQQRYGPGQQAAEAALHRAYKAVRAYEDAVYAAGEARATNQLRTLSGAPRQPSGPLAAAQAADSGAASEFDLVGKYTGVNFPGR